MRQDHYSLHQEQDVQAVFVLLLHGGQEHILIGGTLPTIWRERVPGEVRPVISAKRVPVIPAVIAQIPTI